PAIAGGDGVREGWRPVESRQAVLELVPDPQSGERQLLIGSRSDTRLEEAREKILRRIIDDRPGADPVAARRAPGRGTQNVERLARTCRHRAMEERRGAVRLERSLEPAC